MRRREFLGGAAGVALGIPFRSGPNRSQVPVARYADALLIGLGYRGKDVLDDVQRLGAETAYRLDLPCTAADGDGARGVRECVRSALRSLRYTPASAVIVADLDDRATCLMLEPVLEHLRSQRTAVHVVGELPGIVYSRERNVRAEAGLKSVQRHAAGYGIFDGDGMYRDPRTSDDRQIRCVCAVLAGLARPESRYSTCDLPGMEHGWMGRRHTVRYAESKGSADTVEFAARVVRHPGGYFACIEGMWDTQDRGASPSEAIEGVGRALQTALLLRARRYGLTPRAIARNLHDLGMAQDPRTPPIRTP